MPTIEMEIDVDTLLIKELKVKDDAGGSIKMIENELPFEGNSTLIDQIPIGQLPLLEKHVTILHSNPTYIVIGGRIYCWG